MARFTKQAIMNTFLSMIAERPLDRITVTDIVRACGINRNTFYYYFHDIFALAAAVFEQETDRIFSAVSPHAGLDALFLAAIAAAKKNRRMVYHIYEADHVLLETHLYRAVHGFLLQRAHAETENIDCAAEQIELLASVCAHAAVGSFVHWLNRGMRDPMEETVHALSALLEEGPRLLLAQQAMTAAQEAV